MHSLQLTCRPEDVDLLSGELWEAETEGIQEIDRGTEVQLIAGFVDETRGPELLARFSDYAPEWAAQPDVDWNAQLEEAWPPREVGSRIFLAPKWFTGTVPPGRLRVTHNPGLASGTGEHPCTQLALGALEECVRGRERVLDIGTGSGILAIAALRLGASNAFALDTDTDALQVARENFDLNGLPTLLVAGSADCVAGGCADIVIANISGTVLLALFDDLLRATAPGGWLILTGFTEGEAHTFLQFLPNARLTALNEWRCVYAPISPPAPVLPVLALQ